MSDSRPRPVIIYMAVVAGLQALLGTAAFTAVMPLKVLAVLQFTLIVLVAVGAVIVQGKVTPLSSPRDAAGNKLVPERASGSRMYSSPEDGPTNPSRYPPPSRR